MFLQAQLPETDSILSEGVDGDWLQSKGVSRDEYDLVTYLHTRTALDTYSGYSP